MKDAFFLISRRAGWISAAAGLACTATTIAQSVTTEPIGQSRESRALMLITIADPAGQTPIESRPTLVIVAGLDGRHEIGTLVARQLADKLGAQAGDLLKDFRVCILPSMNPDAFEWAKGRGSKEKPAMAWGRTVGRDQAIDGDRDRRFGEDGAEDLNGDGVITQMRIANPSAASGLRAEWMIDEKDPRVMVKADAGKGQVATHAVITEGIDNDRDGEINEDGVGGSAGGGVSLDMNFPARWPEYVDGSGPHALSEPESKALVTWMLEQPNVAAVLVYGPHDWLVNVPAAGQMDDTGRIPKGIENDDKPYYEEISKLFKDTTKMTASPGGDTAGSFAAWAYSHFGVFTFETPLWVRPDQLKQEEKKDEKAEGGAKDDQGKKDEKKADDAATGDQPKAGQIGDDEIRQRFAEFMKATPEQRAKIMTEFNTLPAEERARIMARGQAMGLGGDEGSAGAEAPAQPAASTPAAMTETPAQPADGRGRGGRGGGGQGSGGGDNKKDDKGGGDSDEAKWLKYSDEKRDKSGFVEWAKFNHPDLGEVEIGGFKPGFQMNPPESEVARLADEQAKFVTALLGKLPKIVVDAPQAESLGDGLWRVSVRIRNDGFLPSMSASGVKARRGMPFVVQPDVPVDRIVSGEKISRSWAIPGSGGLMDAEWIVLAPPDGKGPGISVKIKPSTGAESVIPAQIKEAK